jgi:hypothetical protein
MFNQVFALLESARFPRPGFIHLHLQEYRLAQFKLYQTTHPQDIIYQLLLNRLCPTPLMLNIWLKKLKFWDAKKLFSIMVKKGFASPGTFMSFMKIADKACRFDEVRDIFTQAKQSHQANTLVYRHYIESIGKISYEEAETVFNDVQHKTLISIDTYRCFINLASDHQKAEKLSQITRDILDRGIWDIKLFYTLLNALVKNNLLNEALTIYQRAKLPLPENDITSIDLHGHTYGSAYVYLTLCLHKPDLFERDKPLQVITGRGLHSKHVDRVTGEHPVYQAVKQWVSDKQLVLKHDAFNSGVVYLLLP